MRLIIRKLYTTQPSAGDESMTQDQIDTLKLAYEALDTLRQTYEENKAYELAKIDRLSSLCDHSYPDGSTAIKSEFCTICYRSM